MTDPEIRRRRVEASRKRNRDRGYDEEFIRKAQRPEQERKAAEGKGAK